MEEFKDTYIDGYEVSSYGRLFTKARQIKANKSGGTRMIARTEKKPTCNDKGYMFCQLYINGKNKREYIHRLVAIAFHPNPDNKKQVNHKDGNKSNNFKDNLEWNTSKENNDHAISTGLRKPHGKPVEQLTLAGNFIQKFSSASEASRLTGVSRTGIQECCKPFRDNQGHTAGGFKWRFCS